MSTETGSVEPNVTFVGGRAIEQTETLESDLDTDTRSDAMEAVRKAIRDAGESSAEDAKADKGKDPFSAKTTKKEPDAAPERGPDGKFLPRDPDAKPATKEPAKAAEEPEEVIDPASASVKQLLKNREKLAAQKKDAKDEISRERQAFNQEREAFAGHQRQIQAQAAEVNRQLANLRNLRSDPARVVREAGFDPEQFILDLAQEGTPEGAHKRQMAELNAKIAEMQSWKAQQAKQAEEEQYRYHMQQAQNQRNTAVNQFLKLANEEDKYPHVHHMYKGREKLLVAAGDIISEEYRNLSGGKEGSFEQIMEYLEDELADSAKGLYSKRYATQSQGGSTQGAVKAKPTGSGNAGKSLNPEASGERRALKQKALTDLDGDERREAAKQAVKIALAASENRDD